MEYRRSISLYSYIKALFNQISNSMKSLKQVYSSIIVNSPPHAFVTLSLQSGIGLFMRASNVEYGG